MSRKHYILLADVLRAQVEEAQTKGENARVDALYLTAMTLCELMANDNPRFSRSRFIAACGF